MVDVTDKIPSHVRRGLYEEKYRFLNSLDEAVPIFLVT